VVQQNFNEELRHSFGLKQAPFLKCGSGDEVGAVSRVATVRSSHNSTSAAEAALSWNFIAALEALRHPKAKTFRPPPDSGRSVTLAPPASRSVGKSLPRRRANPPLPATADKRGFGWRSLSASGVAGPW